MPTVNKNTLLVCCLIHTSSYSTYIHTYIHTHMHTYIARVAQLIDTLRTAAEASPSQCGRVAPPPPPPLTHSLLGRAALLAHVATTGNNSPIISSRSCCCSCVCFALRLPKRFSLFQPQSLSAPSATTTPISLTLCWFRAICSRLHLKI
jgi:hypothetical protein